MGTTRLWPIKAIYFLTTAANAPLIRFIVIFYETTGLTVTQIGMLAVFNMFTLFAGGLFWSALCDRTKKFKEIIFGCYVLTIVLITLMYFLQDIHLAVFILSPLSMFFRSVDSGVFDALALMLLENQDKESYGKQRLFGTFGWGLMSLVTGKMIEVTGNTAFMFYTYSILICTLLFILFNFFQFPNQRTSTLRSKGPSSLTELGVFLRPYQLLFFLNLIIYGACMVMVETYLFLYLVDEKEFRPTGTTSLCGMTVAIMCFFELPIFWYEDKLLARFGTLKIMTFCQIVLAVRCLMYAAVPANMVNLVLFIEPLHGITFAAMWIASVKHAYIHGPEGFETVSQTLVGNMYKQLGGIIGNGLWGYVIGLSDYRLTYHLNAIVLGFWAVLWVLGNRLLNKPKDAKSEMHKPLIRDADQN